MRGPIGRRRSAEPAPRNPIDTPNHAFDLATLCSLSQSMAEDIAIPLALRLRNNANSMDRAAERNRQTLETEQRAAAIAAKATRFNEEAAVAAVAAAQQAVHEAKAATRAAP